MNEEELVSCKFSKSQDSFLHVYEQVILIICQVRKNVVVLIPIQYINLRWIETIGILYATVTTRVHSTNLLEVNEYQMLI